MKKLIYTLTFLMLSSTVFAQWIGYQYCSDTYSADGISSLAANGNYIYTTSDYGFYMSSNNGVNWSKIYTNYNTSHVVAANDSYIFAGCGGPLYKSSDNGVNWGRDSTFTSTVKFVTTLGTTVYVGCTSVLYRSTNNGVSWVNLGLNAGPLSIVVSGSDLIVGANNGIYKSTNNGSNWALISQQVGIRSMAISGTKIFACKGNIIYLSTNNGTNWSDINDISLDALTSIVASSPNIFVGGMNHLDSLSSVFVSTDNGATWRTKNEGFNQQQRIRAMVIKGEYIFAGTGKLSHNYIYRRGLSEIIGIQRISSEIPSKYLLTQNYPNPWNPATKIEYSIPKSGLVILKVFNILGKGITTLVNENQSPGTYSVNFQGAELPSGIYFYRLQAGSYSETKQMILIK